jgi:hypothetical protein
MPSRILLITPAFYGIEKKIKSILEDLGYEVNWIENKSLNLDYHGVNSKLRIIRKIYYFFFTPHIKYINRELAKIENLNFDILLAINGYVISQHLIQKLKKSNAKIKSILYLWDSTKMYSWVGESRFFDRVYTFDREDSKTYGWEYLPNFFIKESTVSDTKYDFFFAGKFNPKRLQILDSIVNQAANMSAKLFFKLVPSYKNLIHNKLLWKIFKMTRIKVEWIESYISSYEAFEGLLHRDYIDYEKVEFIELQKELRSSNVIIDIPFASQTGYSHCLIGALGNGKKLITTNYSVQSEPFYNPDQIKIINSDCPVIDLNWINEKANFRSNSYFGHLELVTWLKTLIGFQIIPTLD